MNARPTWATRPNPDALHELAQVRAVAAALGTPLMPWQALAARIATERRPDGAWRYPIMVVTVPRQSGKTTLLRALMVQRAMTRPGWGGFYTAQTGKDANARWADLVKIVTKNPILDQFTTTRKQAGSAALTFNKVDSAIAPFAPTTESLHGYTPTFVALDEAFSFSEQEGTDLMGAIMPAQATVQDRQLWLISTKGPATSTWFHSWVKQGREATLDQAASIGHVEFCAQEDDDLYSPDVWATYHPALGHTMDAEGLAVQALTCPPGEWRRAFGNLTSTTTEAVLDLLTWDNLAEPSPGLPASGPVGVGFDVHHDRTRSAVWAAWMDDAGRAHLQVIASAPGMEWVAGRVAAVAGALGDRARLVAQDDGPVRQVSDQLDREANGARLVTRLSGRDWTTACGALLWRANVGLVAHDGTPALRQAWADAAHRPLGDGWQFSRHLSAGPIADLVAAVVATHAAQSAPAPITPELWFS